MHDFAWFADKRFRVLHDTLHLRPRPAGTSAPIDVWAFYPPWEATLWKEATAYLKRATRFYSQRIGDYPYPQVTGVQSALSAGGGMEYPMITVIGQTYSARELDDLLAHEVGHNWFYGVLGSNERDHPWLDEGLNSYYEGRYSRQFYPTLEGGGALIGGRLIDYNYVGTARAARLGRDRPPTTPVGEVSPNNYVLNAYSKPALLLERVATAVGADRLDTAFQRYYRARKFSHPAPGDFYREMATIGQADYLRDGLETTDRGDFNAWLQRPDRLERFRLRLATGSEQNARLFYLPLAGFNVNDGFLAGLALHNRSLEPRRFEYIVAPMYGFGSKELAGFVGARYRLTRPADWLQRIEVSGGGAAVQ